QNNPQVNQSKRRKPLGGDLAPLHIQSRLTRPVPIAEDGPLPKRNATAKNNKSNKNGNDNNNNSNNTSTNTKTTSTLHGQNLMVPSRLPQKRQATESSTNLVEKLKVPQPQDLAAATCTGTAAAFASGSALASGTVSGTSTGIATGIGTGTGACSTADGTAATSASTIYKRSRLIDYEWQDLDEEDHDDPLMASEYVNDIFTYFYELETRMLPDPNYIQTQKNLKPKMRSILVDWVVEMHLKFRLLPESLFLAINIMDRFMSLENVELDKLQLLATGSLFIAAKYEEVFSPLVKNYAYFTDGSYTEEEILQAEKYILTTLNFDLNYPNPMNFLRRISKADDYDVQSRTLGKYLLEITIVDHRFIGMKPSLCSALAMYLARLILKKIPVWNGNLIHYSGGYRINDMKHCIELLYQYLLQPIEHEEFFKKYAMRKFMKASTLCQSWAKKFRAEGRDLFDERLSTHRLTIESDNS
ncbi:cyclin, partial [Acetobacter pasteurianus]|nr:cyclin [Acetobacter pasteurianus]